MKRGKLFFQSQKEKRVGKSMVSGWSSHPTSMMASFRFSLGPSIRSEMAAAATAARWECGV